MCAAWCSQNFRLGEDSGLASVIAFNFALDQCTARCAHCDSGLQGITGLTVISVVALDDDGRRWVIVAACNQLCTVTQSPPPLPPTVLHDAIRVCIGGQMYLCLYIEGCTCGKICQVGAQTHFPSQRHICELAAPIMCNLGTVWGPDVHLPGRHA